MHERKEPDYSLKTRLHSGVEGRVKTWNDQKGFGFVATEQPPLKIFFHISAVTGRHRRPQLDERVIVKAKYAEGRWTATEVSSPGRAAAQLKREGRSETLLQPVRGKLVYALPLCGLWLLLLLVKLPKLFVWAAVLSLVCLAMYAWDKHSALTQGRRVPEAQLNLAALAGGWPGALLARYLFRHKTVKQPFVAVFWLCVCANVAALLYILLGQPENLSFLWG